MTIMGVDLHIGSTCTCATSKKWLVNIMCTYDLLKLINQRPTNQYVYLHFDQQRKPDGAYSCYSNNVSMATVADS